MVQRVGGFRRKSRHRLVKHYKRRGKISTTNFLQEFTAGDNVALVAEPAYQKGMYQPRFHGKSGRVLGMQGHCYTVCVTDGHKDKTFIVHPVHLKRLTHG